MHVQCILIYRFNKIVVLKNNETCWLYQKENFYYSVSFIIRDLNDVVYKAFRVYSLYCNNYTYL